MQIHVHLHLPPPPPQLPPDALGGLVYAMPPAGGPGRYVPDAPPSAASPGAQAIGDGTLLRLIAQYGPQVLALLIQLGLIKLPTVPGVSAAP